MWFANDFHEWQSHKWKLMANQIASDQENIIHGKESIMPFLTLMSWTHNNNRSLISPLSPGTFFLTWYCDVTMDQSVTSRDDEEWYCDVIFADCSCEATWVLAQAGNKTSSNPLYTKLNIMKLENINTYLIDRFMFCVAIDKVPQPLGVCSEKKPNGFHNY